MKNCLTYNNVRFIQKCMNNVDAALAESENKISIDPVAAFRSAIDAEKAFQRMTDDFALELWHDSSLEDPLYVKTHNLKRLAYLRMAPDAEKTLRGEFSLRVQDKKPSLWQGIKAGILDSVGKEFVGPQLPNFKFTPLS